LAGKKEDGTEFALPDTTLDYCNVSDSNYFCSGDSKFDVCDSQFDEPRVTAFQCTTFGVFPTSGWLTWSNFPAKMKQALLNAFPEAAGLEPIILVNPVPLPGDNDSVRDVCIQAGFGNPSRTLGISSPGINVTTTSPGPLTFG